MHARTALSVTLPLELRRELLDAARRAAPREACGFLLGHDRTITRLLEVANISRSSNRFVMDPDAASEAIAAAGQAWRILGVWHSHPRSPAEPSRVDLEHCYWPISVIASLDEGHVRAWDNAAELPLAP